MDAVSLFPFAIILVAFYLLIIRPARTRQRAALELQRRLEPGSRVMTTSGIFATVVAVDDDAVSLEVSPGTTIRFAKPAVARILTDEESSGDSLEESSDGFAEDPTDDHRPESDRPAR